MRQLAANTPSRLLAATVRMMRSVALCPKWLISPHTAGRSNAFATGSHGIPSKPHSTTTSLSDWMMNAGVCRKE